MKLSEDRLIGWLCFLRTLYEETSHFQMPPAVRDALVDRGWMAVDGVREDGAQLLRVTGAGQLTVEQHAAEWGVELVKEDA